MFLGSSILGIPGPASGAGTAGMAPVVEGMVPVTAGTAPVTGGFASDGATVPSFAAALGLSAAQVFSGRVCVGLCVMKMHFLVCGVRPSLERHGQVISVSATCRMRAGDSIVPVAFPAEK